MSSVRVNSKLAQQLALPRRRPFKQAENAVVKPKAKKKAKR